ncbi:MAG: tRNA adenosine(34) deaminase TadA [Longimicrobiales bacterium]|nr:tRNA adenosine(34) deaminase TadA [Longimicrobiales bacterium]
MAPEDGAADERWMERALELAREAESLGEVPVGAVVVREDTVLGEGFNRTITEADPTAHAEVVAIRRAADRQRDWRLLDTTLYATLEPCAMCAGAIVLARIPRVVFAASDPKAGMGGSLGNLLEDARLNHRCAVTRGVGREAASHLLKGFFQARR